MPPSVSAYLFLLVLVGVLRLGELVISRRNQARMRASGVSKVPEPGFRWMVLLHVGVLICAAVEVVFLHRPFILPLAVAASAAFIFANLLRWWVIRTLAGHWNVQVMASGPLGVITSGPYRWVRHPNYLAVVLELLSLPLIHTAWITAIAGTLANAWVLRNRLAVEEPVLMSNPMYRAEMGRKPRFIPGFF
jgi:methyltransferase